MADVIHLIDPDFFVRFRRETPWCHHGRYVRLVEHPDDATCKHCLRKHTREESRVPAHPRPSRWQRVAAAIAQHDAQTRDQEWTGRCKCGARFDPVEDDGWERYIEHQARAVLAAAGKERVDA